MSRHVSHPVIPDVFSAIQHPYFEFIRQIRMSCTCHPPVTDEVDSLVPLRSGDLNHSLTNLRTGL